MTLAKKLIAEFLGTAALLAVVVGSGIMGENLSGGDAAIALLANSIATGAGLIFLILGFADISGAHFNPAVSLSEYLNKKIGAAEFFYYAVFQIAGAVFGVALANLMFNLPIFFISTKTRTGSSQFLSEFIATFGLIAVIYSVSKYRPNLVFLAVSAYITSAYWFTASTSFANPAVTLARSLSNTFAGIKPENVPMFILAQLSGALTAVFIFKWLLAEKNDV